MYQEKERQNDVESPNTRYNRGLITFNVPEGYQVKNLEELTFEQKLGKKRKENLLFESS